MKTVVILCVLAAVVAFVLGVVGYFVPGTLLFSAEKWCQLTQTLLLFSLGFTVWDYFTKK